MDRIFQLIALIFALTVHEFCHAYGSLSRNTTARNGRLSLNPLAHIDPFAMTLLLPISLILVGSPWCLLQQSQVPFNPAVGWAMGGRLGGVCGPASNLCWLPFLRYG
jgi:Zn-dependent protease